MDTKKVDAIPLSYLAFDGSIKTGNFMAEFNDATFSGNVSAMEGTFSGKLTAQAVNAAMNLNIAGQSVARTTVSRLALRNRYTGGSRFQDGDPYASIHSINFIVPNDDVYGGWFTCGIQYELTDWKGDNDQYECQYRILLDGVSLYTSPWGNFGAMYRYTRNFYHEIVGRVNSRGTHNVDIQIRFEELFGQVYPEWRNIVLRVDYIRK